MTIYIIGVILSTLILSFLVYKNKELNSQMILFNFLISIFLWPIILIGIIGICCLNLYKLIKGVKI